MHSCLQNVGTARSSGMLKQARWVGICLWGDERPKHDQKSLWPISLQRGDSPAKISQPSLFTLPILTASSSHNVLLINLNPDLQNRCWLSSGRLSCEVQHCCVSCSNQSKWLEATEMGLSIMCPSTCLRDEGERD